MLTLLRGPGRTVAELAEELKLTGNAVRGHLAALERDGLVEARALRRGAKKPSQLYGLTPAGEAAFPKAHGALLIAMLDELGARHSPAELATFLRSVGQRLQDPREIAGATREARIEAALRVFSRLGGSARVEDLADGLTVQCHDCPLADVSASHAEPCAIVRGILSDLLQVEVRTACAHGSRPTCRFEIDLSPGT
ncbi:MAG: helix-turn-helix domain-containing protein [Candidatus Eisenbacteria bacterium]